MLISSRNSLGQFASYWKGLDMFPFADCVLAHLAGILHCLPTRADRLKCVAANTAGKAIMVMKGSEGRK